ncbi:hypothetical protein I5V54_04930 [Stenotrophomonas maltophilia]|nr:hypothetical protein [Stenotrophomonas maltophilia]MBH1843087.1 hypothetical protein [Stenotrophomonas maltophilia]
MKPIVLVGHQHNCPIHGTGTVVSGASGAQVNVDPIIIGSIAIGTCWVI